MIREALIGSVLIRVDGCALGGVLADESLERSGIRVLYHLRAYAVRLAVLGTYYRCLAYGATASA